jgi:inward rectifier potassium channel
MRRARPGGVTLQAMTDPNVTSGAPGSREETNDLGFGRVVAQQVQGRFLGKDGTPNSRKYGLGSRRWARFYRTALDMSWPAFLTWLVGIQLLANGVFALGYMALGPEVIAGSELMGIADPFLRAFGFSVGVYTTVGTGTMHAVGSTANWLVVLESFCGPLAMVTGGGVLIARLMRPRSRVRFSEGAVIAPYRNGRGFMFRIVNAGLSEMSETHVEVNLAWFEDVGGRRTRRFHQLALERDSVEFFTLHWTIVHPIDRDSPLRGVTPEKLREAAAEFLVVVTGLDDTFAARVSARSSYYWDEVRWDAALASMFVASVDGVLTIDIDRLGRIDRLAEGSTSVPAPSEGLGAS